MTKMMSPEALIYREFDQTSLLEVAERFFDGITNPLVVIDNSEIIDGHNRAEIAKQNGWEVPVVSISRMQYELLLEKGFDDMEICFASLIADDEANAAYAIHNQFPGANIAERGFAALEAME